MRNKITITGLGDVQLVKPFSFAAISDLNVRWREEQERGNRVGLSRLVAAAIGIAWDRSANDGNPPIYNVASGMILADGGDMMDYLLKDGALPASIYDKRILVKELWALLPKEVEVAEATDNFPEENGMAGRGGSADIEAVGERA